MRRCGANDKNRVGFIGIGKMGRSNLGFALHTETSMSLRYAMCSNVTST